MGHKAAHKVLKQLRADMCTPNRITAESRDLTDGVDFDGKAYLASRADKDVVIGPGLARVEARFLSARDPNYLSLPVPNRFDFVQDRRLYRARATGGDAARPRR